jgi:putative ABC transport system permease protein
MFGMKVGTSLTAIEPEDIRYTIGTKIYAESGRILEDGDNGKCVAIIGNTFAKNTKLEIGDEIDYNNETKFEIVGIIEKTGKDVDNMVFVPLKTMQEIEGEIDVQRIRVIADQNMVEDVSREIGFEVSDVNVLSYKELIRQITDALNSINLAVIGIGSISAIVAGLMVMVVMLMSVTERRREIGIMKAIGATKNMILKQFLLESLIIGLIGGTFGIILGSISALLLKAIFNFPSAINLWLIFIALGFALFITILAGFYPAWKASRLDPIESLRYE